MKIIDMKFTNEEMETLIELICNEQTKHLIAENKYDTEKYNQLEVLKVKIKENM